MFIRILFSVMIFSIVSIGILQFVSVYANSNTENQEALISQAAFVDVPVELSTKPVFPEITLSANGAFIAEVDLSTGTMTTIYAKNELQKLPIASITKLLTAFITTKDKKYTDTFSVSESAITGPWPSNKFEVGDVYTLRELIEAALIESNNDAARMLTAPLGERRFVQSMNTAARDLGLSQTNFLSPDGTARVVNNEMVENTSTVMDIAQLIVAIHKNNPELLKITTKPYAEIINFTGERAFVAHTTNKLLESLSREYSVLGGKTGTSQLESKHLVLLFTDTEGKTYVTVVLDSKDNFADMQIMIDALSQYRK